MRKHENIDPDYKDAARNDDRDLFIFINNPYLISTKQSIDQFNYDDDEIYSFG
jgi:hypothetical protein